MNMNIRYNVPIEVTEKQYNLIMNNLQGVCAGRKETTNGETKHFIKVLFMKFSKDVKRILKNY